MENIGWYISALVLATLYNVLTYIGFESKQAKLATIASTVATLGISLYLTLQEKQEAKDDKINQQIQYDSTTNKLNKSVNKIESTIDTLRSLQSNAHLIIDSLSKQLFLQNQLAIISREISEKNQQIFTKQEDVFQNTNVIVNPLFPLSIFLTYEISFDDIHAKTMVDYVNKIRNDIIKDPNNPPSYVDPITYSMAVPDSITFYEPGSEFELLNSDSLFEAERTSYFLDPLFRNSFYFKLVKDTEKDIVKKHNDDIFFNIKTLKDYSKHLYVSFNKKKFYISYEANNIEMTNSLHFNTPFKPIGFSDLIDYYFIFEPNSHITQYELSDFTLFQNKNFKNRFIFRFKEKEAGMYPYPLRKVYVHKISNRDYR